MTNKEVAELIGCSPEYVRQTALKLNFPKGKIGVETIYSEEQAGLLLDRLRGFSRESQERAIRAAATRKANLAGLPLQLRNSPYGEVTKISNKELPPESEWIILMRRMLILMEQIEISEVHAQDGEAEYTRTTVSTHKVQR